jgi:hypothetical protein
MNRKILFSSLCLMMIALMLTPFAFGERIELKNNDKFKPFEVQLTTGGATNVEVDFIPSVDQCNKVSGSYDEIMAAYTITVDGTEYDLNDDFLYTGHATWTIWDPELPLAVPSLYTPGSKILFDVKYMYDFSAVADGIDGTIEMHARGIGESIFDIILNGKMFISSMQGTGDLKNVVIQAIGVAGPGHIGIVSGWPE